MIKINMKKYGFEYCPDENFSDDGNYFYVYRVGRVRVSKLVDGDYAFISGRIDGRLLKWEEYSTLPHYKALDRLNYIPRAGITEEDLVQLYNDCIAYEQEYTELENEVKNNLPSEEAVRNWVKINAICLKIEFELLEKHMGKHLANLFSLDSWDYKHVREDYNTLKRTMVEFQDIEDQVKRCIEYSWQRDWLAIDPKNKKNNYTVESCLEVLHISKETFKEEYSRLVQDALKA